MAAESNTGVHHEQSLGSALNWHAISFQPNAMDSTSEMSLMGKYYGLNRAAGGIMFSGNSSSNPGLSVPQTTNISGSPLLDSVPGLKHDAGLAVEWSVEEQYRLEEGLAKYADEPSILRYIKIAAILRDKTVRDVALRCRWMMRKRRKHEEHSSGKKVKDRKDKSVESSSKANKSSVTPLTMAASSLMTNHQRGSDHMGCEALAGARHILERNNEVLGCISANLSTLKLQENIDLFCRSRNSITAILNDMRNMPGVMSRMPPLPLSINEELANSILPSTNEKMFGLPSGTHLKQEPGC